MAYTHVDKPIRVGAIELKNRVFRPAHGTMIGHGSMTDDLIAYYEARARGGVGLSILEVGSVHWTTPLCLNIFDPSTEPGMRKLVEKVKPHGMKLFQQLWHAGNSTFTADGSPPWSASDIPNVELGIVPLPMTKMMIDEIVGAYAAMAVKMEAYGLDGVDIHCAHGYLPAQFLSTNTNKREDEYGGSFENRARFSIEVARAVRSAVSSNFVVGIRVAPDLVVNGAGVDENLRLAQMMEQEGLIDYVNISVGNYNTYHKLIGGMHEPVGYELPTSVPIARGITKVPTMVVGRFRTLEEMDQVIRAGDADMVGTVRAMIADPDLVNKSLAGKVEEVRPCVACNQSCAANAWFRIGIECAVNAGAGHELIRGDHLLTPAETPKKVLVIGGGPAGMEAARVAAMRGHKVTLAEANSVLGGTLRAAAKAPTRHQFIDILTWLEQEIFRLGVEVQLSTYMDVDDVHNSGADAVIVACGSMPRLDGITASHPGQPIAGMDRPNVLSAFDLFMSPPAKLGSNAVVFDDVGHYEAMGAAEHLVNHGLKVTYVTRMREFAPAMQPTSMNEPFLIRMAGKPFDYRIRTRVIAIEDGGVVVGPAHLTDDTTTGTERIATDTVIVVTHNRSNNEIFYALSERNSVVKVVGDAKSPRYLEHAIREGHIAATEI